MHENQTLLRQIDQLT
jgi:predicted  nucleic acid-binding Zn-ribbon protein